MHRIVLRTMHLDLGFSPRPIFLNKLLIQCPCKDQIQIKNDGYSGGVIVLVHFLITDFPFHDGIEI